jgi:hypothetical protein
MESLLARHSDELHLTKDTFKHLQDERKRDIDETALFIKQLISQTKQEI